MEGQLALFGVLDQLHPHHKAQAACNDHKHDHCLDIVVVDIGHQGGIGPKLTKQVKARIAESRNGREHTHPDALRAKLRHKGKQQQQDADALKQGGQAHYDTQHVLGLRIAISRHALAQHSQVPEAHAPPHGQREKAGQGHQTQASHLDQDQDHRLPEHRELGPGIPHDQTGHAGGAGGREHGVDHPHPPVAAGNGQRQQQRTQCDHDHKTDADDLGRAVPPRFVPVLCTMMPEWVLEWLFHTFLRRQHTPALPLSFSPL